MAVLVGATAPSAARAMTVDVTYQISGWLDSVSPADEYEILGGTATVRYFDATGTGGSSIQPAQFRSFDALFRVQFTQYGSYYWRGQIDIAGGIQAFGSLTAPGGMLRLPLAALGAGVLTRRYCSSSTECITYQRSESLTLDFVFMDVGITSGATSLNDERQLGSNGTFGFFLGQALTSGVVTMREVSRTVVPEPTTGLLLSVGLALGLALLVQRRR
jgi:hypothetical protein